MRSQRNKTRTFTLLFLPDARSCSWVTGAIRLLSYCLIFTLSGLATSIILYNELHIVTLNLNQNHPPTNPICYRNPSNVYQEQESLKSLTYEKLLAYNTHRNISAMQHRTPYLSLIARSGYWTMTDPTLSRLSMSSLNPNLQNSDTNLLMPGNINNNSFVIALHQVTWISLQFTVTSTT